MNQVEAESEGNGIPLRFAFIAPALFGVSLLGAGLMTLSVGLPEDIAHAVSSLAVFAAMAWLYRSSGSDSAVSGWLPCFPLSVPGSCCKPSQSALSR